MKKLILTAILLLTAFGCVTYVVYANALKVESQPKVTAVKPEPATVETLLKRVNEERAKVGVAPLTLDPAINATAQRKADDMFKNNDTDHIDANGEHGYMYMKDAGIRCSYISENISYELHKADSTTESAMQGWINSPAHYKAMVDPKYTSTGFGIHGWAVVEHFCVAV